MTAENVTPDLRRRAWAWMTSERVPQVSLTTMDRWSLLIGRWISDADRPLLVRSEDLPVGSRREHESGRWLLGVDDRVARMAMKKALDGECPTADEFQNNILRIDDRNVQDSWDLGWIDTRSVDGHDLTSGSIGIVIDHFRCLIHPWNLFAVPRGSGFAQLAVTKALARQRRDQLLADSRTRQTRRMNSCDGADVLPFSAPPNPADDWGSGIETEGIPELK